MAALAAICSAPPGKAGLFREPCPFNPRAESIRPPARKFPACGREFCLDAPEARLTFVRKRPRCHAFGFDSFAMAALAAICSAFPKKLCFSGNPALFNPRAESIRPPARKFPACGREFCLDAPKARLTFVRKRPRCHAFGFDSFAMAALAAICSAPPRKAGLFREPCLF